MELFERPKKKTSFAQVNKLIWGMPKCGKTTFASHLKDGNKEPLFIMTEDGEGTLQILRRKVTSWEGLKKLVGFMKDKKEELQKNHSCIVLDLYAEMYELKKSEFREIHQQEPADMAHGKGWDMVNSPFRELMRDVLNILPVTIIAHARERELTINGVKKKILEPWIGGSALIFGNGKVDAIGYISGDTISFKPSEDLIAGSRYPQIQKVYPLDHKDMAKTVALIEKDFNAG